MSDDELVQATIAGDLSAFEELVRLLRYPLVSSAYHLTGNAEDAQDLAQETLVEGYRKLNTLRDGARVRGWLFTILRNIASAIESATATSWFRWRSARKCPPRHRRMRANCWPVYVGCRSATARSSPRVICRSYRMRRSPAHWA